MEGGVATIEKGLERGRNAEPLTLVDLFAGCGGLSLGLEMAGFMPVFVNELNADALRTYIQNRVHVNEWLDRPGFNVKDVKEMVLNTRYVQGLRKRFESLPFRMDEVDLLVGGPPCQGFSGIGHRRSYSVDKEQLPSNHLYQDMAVVIHRLRPRAFLFENVRGLMQSKWTDSGRPGEVWDQVKETFANIRGYRTAEALVFAKNYGVPQNRPRVLLVGIRDDVRFTESGKPGDAIVRGFLPPPTGETAPDLVELLGDLEDPEYVNGGITRAYPMRWQNKVQRLLRTAPGNGHVARKDDPVTEMEYSNHSPRVVAKFGAMRENGGVIPKEFRTKKFAQRILPATWEGGRPTITATSLPDDYVHYSMDRCLTVREWARLQMFPDWYQFAGKRTTGGIRRAGNPRAGIFEREVPKYTQIGNAVPVKLAREVGAWLAKILRGEK